MAFLDQFQLAQDAAFVARVQMALAKSAIAVMAEDASTDYHAVRSIWAATVLRDLAHYGAIAAYGVASNTAITVESSDSDIEFTVNSQWNAYAGVVTEVPVG